MILIVSLSLLMASSELLRSRELSPVTPLPGGHTWNVRDFGAIGDGRALDTKPFNEAIEACAINGGGEVLVPAGRYVCGTIHLRNRITLNLASGAVLIGTTNLACYDKPMVPAFMPEAKWGKWHRALIVGEDVEDITITGQGVIDGNKVFDPTGEEKMRGPHTIALVNCKRFVLRNVSIVDSANYAVFFQLSDEIEIRNVKITGGWDGVHFRGAPGHACHNVSIIGCQFYTGDDSIAGRYWDNVVISDCIANSSCNGIRLIGPAKRLLVNNCLFYGPGLQPHRSSRRTNMLSGIILQPGAWDKTEGLLDDVLLTNNTMHNVASPITIWTRGDNRVERITVVGLTATGVYRSALSIESWAETPITNIVICRANIEFTGGGKRKQGKEEVKSPGFDVRPLPSWGIYARNIEQLTLEDVRLSLSETDLRPAIMMENVQEMNVDALNYSHIPGVEQGIVTNVVRKISTRGTD